MSWKMPDRQPDDGPVSVSRHDDDRLQLCVESKDGERQSITVGPYNAARLFGMLAMFLEIPLPPRIGKEIKF